jgi:hypothetical protein
MLPENVMMMLMMMMMMMTMMMVMLFLLKDGFSANVFVHYICDVFVNVISGYETHFFHFVNEIFE